MIVEDNPTLCEAITHGLREQKWIVEPFTKGFEAEEAAATGDYDIIVLDLMLPDRDGLDICKALRRRGVKTPILILSALSSTTDRVKGLDFGADDFLAKPFEFEELIARIRAILRRGQAGESAVLRIADLELDLNKRQARRGTSTISLTTKEFALLEFFMRKSDRVLTRSQIGASVWDMNFDPSSNVIDVYVSALRRKIDKGFPTPLIHTMIGSGYMFSATKP